MCDDRVTNKRTPSLRNAPLPTAQYNLNWCRQKRTPTSFALASFLTLDV